MPEHDPVFLSTPNAPMPSLEDLAKHGERPAPDVEALIRAVANDVQDPYWVHYEVRQTFRDVTIGQVAWVMTNA